jgi:hypothetical protein
VSFADDVNKLLAEAYEERIRGTILDAGPARPDELTVEKTGCIVPMSIEMAMDSGLITEEEARARGWEPTVYPPTPWHRRLRYRIWRWRDAAALKLYRLVAGHDPEYPDE